MSLRHLLNTHNRVREALVDTKVGAINRLIQVHGFSREEAIITANSVMAVAKESVANSVKSYASSKRGAI